jgi:hypothetical protein
MERGAFAAVACAGVGAIVVSALTPRTVYVRPPPPALRYYAPAGYARRGRLPGIHIVARFTVPTSTRDQAISKRPTEAGISANDVGVADAIFL